MPAGGALDPDLGFSAITACVVNTIPATDAALIRPQRVTWKHPQTHSEAAKQIG